MTIEILGVDIAKNVFQLRGVNCGGHVVGLRSAFTLVRCDQRAEMVQPAANGLVGDHDVAFANKSSTSRKLRVNRR